MMLAAWIIAGAVFVVWSSGRLDASLLWLKRKTVALLYWLKRAR
jgi:hypothetical protein